MRGTDKTDVTDDTRAYGSPQIQYGLLSALTTASDEILQQQNQRKANYEQLEQHSDDGHGTSTQKPFNNNDNTGGSVAKPKSRLETARLKAVQAQIVADAAVVPGQNSTPGIGLNSPSGSSTHSIENGLSKVSIASDKANKTASRWATATASVLTKKMSKLEALTSRVAARNLASSSSGEGSSRQNQSSGFKIYIGLSHSVRK